MTGRGAVDWAGPGAALALVAVIGVLIALPSAQHTSLQSGLLDALLRFDRSLPLVGLGLALAPVSRREIGASAAFLLVGLGLGAVLGAWIAALIEADFTLFSYLFMLGPLQCLAVGGALVVPPSLRAVTLPPASLACGVALGIGALADVPGGFRAEYSVGAGIAALALVLVPLLLLRDLRWSGLAVATRIAGSWLIAIGLMLLALEIGRMRG